MKTKYKFIYFTKEIPVKKRKTDIWACRTMASGSIIGEIKWRGSWRQYCFYPEDGTLYNNTCLIDIADFINQLMEERKK